MTAASRIVVAGREGGEASDRRDMIRVYPAHAVDSTGPDRAGQ